MGAFLSCGVTGVDERGLGETSYGRMHSRDEPREILRG
jgi:hypothetical protein